MALGNFFGSHRGPNLPKMQMPALPKLPPSRPAQSLPPDYDTVNGQIFGDEFEMLPLPDEASAKARMPVCNAQNMNYIRSAIPGSVIPPYSAFFKAMAAKQWRSAGVTPSAQAPRMQGLGAHRPAGAPDQSRPLGNFAKDWDLIPGLERVNAYAFRGDKRRISDIRAAGGFQPPSMRTDNAYVDVVAKKFASYMKARFGSTVDLAEVTQYVRGQGASGRAFTEYTVWRAILQNEEMHIGRMVASEFLKGYISTSRDVLTALGFAKAASDDGQKAPTCAVYALHVDGGFLLPPLAQHVHGTKGTEAEIAYPGVIPWLKVMAFRTFIDVKMSDARTFKKSGVIFVRRGFRAADAEGFQKVFDTLGSISISS